METSYVGFDVPVSFPRPIPGPNPRLEETWPTVRCLTFKCPPIYLEAVFTRHRLGLGQCSGKEGGGWGDSKE